MRAMKRLTRSVHNAMSCPLVRASSPPLILFLRSDGTLPQMALRAPCLARNLTDRATACSIYSKRPEPQLVGPRVATPEGKIIRIGYQGSFHRRRFKDLIGDPFPLAIGNRFFLSVEAQAQLLAHVAGRGPTH